MTPQTRRRFPARRTIVRAACVASLIGLSAGALPQPALAAPASPAPALSADIVGLRQGATGSDVKSVQQALLDAGVKVPGGADGIFGPKTRSAVTAFQSRQGLPTTGEIDQATAAALEAANGSGGSTAPATSSGILAVGARGDAVEALQQALLDAGVWVAGGADGIFGPATRTAVTNFQRWNSLDQTGTLTPATAEALGLDGSSPAADPAPADDPDPDPADEPAPAASTSSIVGLEIGARGAAVKQLQTALIAAGITVRGGADGAFGPMTRAAVVDFQTRRGLSASGAIDQPTADALAGSAPAAPSTPAPSNGGSSASAYVGLKVGSNGNAVKELQRALMDTGLALRGGADGVFGNVTRTTLMLFQKTNGDEQTGVVSADDAKLLGLGSASGPQGIAKTDGYAVFGERGDRVRSLQEALLTAGISFAGGADGHFGAATAGAIMDFQRREGLSVTGKVDQQTADRLGSAKAPAPAAPSTAEVTMDVFPVQGRCWFGDTWHAPRGGGRLHVGTDVIAASGKLLYAVVDGEVSKMYYDYPGALAGNGLRIAQPNGTYFTYLHLDAFAEGIDVGTEVKAGDVIGYVGNTGNSATPHLHFEVHPSGGSAVNPYPMLKAIDACDVEAPRGS